MTDLLETWTMRLTREAEDLDLFDSEDRASYRVRVQEATKGATCTALADLLAAMGMRRQQTRAKITRAIAEHFIIRLCNPEAS